LKEGEMDATVSGLGSFFASNTLVDNTTIYDILATIDNDSLQIRIIVTKEALVPYTIDVSTDDNSKITYCVLQSNGSCNTYSADKLTANSSGQIKITSLTPTLQGTFSGTLQQIGGSGSVTISNGAFNGSYK
jgi:hypothetical protein